MLKLTLPYLAVVASLTTATLVVGLHTAFPFQMLAFVWPLIVYGWSHMQPTPLVTFFGAPIVTVLYWAFFFMPLLLACLTRRWMWLLMQLFVPIFIVATYFTYGLRFFG